MHSPYCTVNDVASQINMSLGMEANVRSAALTYIYRVYVYRAELMVAVRASEQASGVAGRPSGGWEGD